MKATLFLTIKLDIQSNATYEGKPLKILDQRDKILRTKIVPLVKALLSSRVVEEASRYTNRVFQIV